MSADSRSEWPALLLRSTALFGLLFHFGLIARDLVDLGVYSAALTLAFILAFLGAFTPPRHRIPGRRANWWTLAVVAALPWLCRAALVLPRLFITGIAVRLDATLLHFDRNLMVFILPYYWAAAGTYAVAHSRRLLRADILVSILALFLLFPLVRAANLDVYAQPVLLIAVFAGIAVLLLFALMLSLPQPYRVGGRDIPGSAVITAILVFGASWFLIAPLQEGDLDRGGGLIQPDLFRFDFSQILTLESEISLNDDLVLIVRKEPEETHTLLRRYVLSGYDQKRGFYRDERRDEQNHPQRLPDATIDLATPTWKAGQRSRQEFYLVNFDPSAFIALNQPRRIVPFDRWDAASFSSAYAVESETSSALPFELIDAGPASPNPEALGMPTEEYRWYTDYGDDEKIAAYAREQTAGLTGYWDRVQALYEHLKYGEYRYSLKPGIAADGNQLHHFLFLAKKGYCSYFAFSLSLLLRSQGIPARVAVGFFVDPETNTFDYYPVRSDMAHAWVEVFFPGYGWIEYDPTSEVLAEGENFRFSDGVPPDLFERLMKEILRNRDLLRPRESPDADDPQALLPGLTAQTLSFLRTYWTFLTGVLLLAIFAGIRFGKYLTASLAPQPRAFARRLGAHVRRRLALAGFRGVPAETAGDFGRRLDQGLNLNLEVFFESVTAARFAPVFDSGDRERMGQRYRAFSAAYRRSVPGPRRALAVLFPPLALLLPPSGTRTPPSGGWTFLAALLLAGILSTDQLKAQATESAADRLYADAASAQESERWEQAISLYKTGAAAYPEDVRFPRALGDLYQSRRLYNLAWDEYRRVETRLPNDPDLLYQLAGVSGRLNQDDTAIAYLRRLLELDRDNRDAIGDLGWMYFKRHRLQEGEALLLEALQRLYPDRGFSMTLGTIYADMFRYEESKTRYLESIADAEQENAQLFLAVAYYNLSILESRHYHYADAFQNTELSLAAEDRASGHLARGELQLRRLDFSRTFADYFAAYEIDVSPLSKINIAQAYQIAGKLQEARSYAEETLSARDLSWMLNYGTDLNRHYRDLHDILSDTYKGLAKSDPNPVRRVQHRFFYLVHEKLYRKYSLSVASAYAGEHQELDALLNYYNAFEEYPRINLAYLRQARRFETALIPQSAPTYDIEEGRLVGDPALLRRALEQLDPVWERDLIADVYANLALLAAARRDTEAERDAAERLYALNRGALRQNGIRLPVRLDLGLPPGTSAATAAGVRRRLVQALRDSGITADTTDTARGRYLLRIDLSANNATGELDDLGRGTTLLRRTSVLPSFDRKALADFSRVLEQGLFAVD